MSAQTWTVSAQVMVSTNWSHGISAGRTCSKGGFRSIIACTVLTMFLGAERWEKEHLVSTVCTCTLMENHITIVHLHYTKFMRQPVSPVWTMPATNHALCGIQRRSDENTICRNDARVLSVLAKCYNMMTSWVHRSSQTKWCRLLPSI